jgi:hypothetical protein
MTPQECVLDAVLRAQSILADYIEPGPHDCRKTINRLFDIFDDEKLVTAVNKMNLNLAQLQWRSGTNERRHTSVPAINDPADEID